VARSTTSERFDLTIQDERIADLLHRKWMPINIAEILNTTLAYVEQIEEGMNDE